MRAKTDQPNGIAYSDPSQESDWITMFCPTCNVNSPQPHGYYGKNRTPRYRCRECRRTFSPRSVKPCKALNLPDEKLFRILDCLAEGCSVRSTARLCDVHIATVLKVLRIAGEKCERVLQEQIR